MGSLACSIRLVRMRTSTHVLGLLLAVLSLSLASHPEPSQTKDERAGKAFSLFSIVQFPNQQCTGSSSSSTYGTCYTSSECSAKGGSADGNCAAGFGVCCVIYTTTCGTAISTNTTYIRNPGYPSSYTASSASTCTYTFNKVSADICQLRLDFQTFSGFATSTTAGSCYDTLAMAGQTGVDPPSICGTNTGYHMYTEFGATSTDTITMTLTYGSSGLTTAKTFNILARQISCTSSYKAPTDCTQYFTGVSGNVQSYSYGQFLKSQYYTNCIRTEKGYCGIQWKQSSTTSPDPFGILGTVSPAVGAEGSSTTLCTSGFVHIPGLSMDGITGIPVPLATALAFQSNMCGLAFGIEGQTTGAALITRVQPFILGVYSDTTTAQPGTGFNLDYTQLPC